MNSSAVLSADGMYRYELWRTGLQAPLGTVYGGTRTCAFVMLNPSTADHAKDDPTIRRCIRFASEWGYDRLAVVNLYGFRATSPRVLLQLPEALRRGPDNMAHVFDVLVRADLRVCAWGVNGHGTAAALEVLRGFSSGAPNVQPGKTRDLLATSGTERPPELHHLGFTRDHAPRHPLYVKAEQQPVPWL